ncbi:hypothetical protein, partial [Pantoea agglomerans]|uniref:hypothetical protein n=1 Tax=Enterobacter agglomerans TaxID=549 RepID=UPI002032BA8C
AEKPHEIAISPNYFATYRCRLQTAQVTTNRDNAFRLMLSLFNLIAASAHPTVRILQVMIFRGWFISDQSTPTKPQSQRTGFTHSANPSA